MHLARAAAEAETGHANNTRSLAVSWTDVHLLRAGSGTDTETVAVTRWSVNDMLTGSVILLNQCSLPAQS